MANVIIGIHGLGNKPPEQVLESWWKLAMIEGLSANNYNTILPKFEMVFWADILHEKRLDVDERDVSSPLYIDERYTPAPENFPVEDHSKRKMVVDYLNRQMNRMFLNEDLSLNYSFITDSIISRYFKDLEIYYSEESDPENTPIRKANNRIRDRLYNKLLEHKNDEIMLISHSMGSIIAYDVLTILAPDIKINTFITMGSPLSFPVIISKIASEQRKRKNNNIRLTVPEGISKHWFNFSDILDKISFNYALSDDFLPNQSGIKPIDYLVTNNYVLNGIRNPHKCFGYLRTPEFSKILNDFILSERINLRQKVARQVSRFINNIKAKVSPDH
jgi:hypothetical protein